MFFVKSEERKPKKREGRRGARRENSSTLLLLLIYTCDSYNGARARYYAFYFFQSKCKLYYAQKEAYEPGQEERRA